jgi:Kdo-III transferase WaaZ
MSCSDVVDSSLFQLDSGQCIALHDFAESRGRFSGAVFLVASGPSVLTFPMQRYSHIPMIAMNGSIARFIEEGIKPLFYLCDDRGVAKRKGAAVAQGITLAENAGLGLAALQEAAKHSPHALSAGKLHLLERVNRQRESAAMSDRRFALSVRNDPEYSVEWSLFRQKRNRIGFSRNLCNGYFNGRTIAYAALQLAYHLGFERVYLVGVDMSPEQGQFYDPQGLQVPSRLGDDYADYILPSFELMSRRVLSDSFQVFNLSVDSRLPSDVIKKIKYNQLDDLLA